MNVSAIIVTRGDVDLDQILASLPDEWEVLVWDNGDGSLMIWRDGEQIDDIDVSDVGVYGRYAAISYASHDVIYVQDDDCVLASPANVVAAYQPGTVTFNMPYAFRDSGVDSVMVGFGAVFDRGLPNKAFGKFSLVYKDGIVVVNPLFQRTCDMVFTTLTATKMIHEPVELLDYSYAENRMWQQPGHQEERRMIHDLASEAT